MSKELSNNLKEKLSEVIQIWADENLIGKPAILASATYYHLEKVLLEKTEEIERLF